MFLYIQHRVYESNLNFTLFFKAHFFINDFLNCLVIIGIIIFKKDKNSLFMISNEILYFNYKLKHKNYIIKILNFSKNITINIISSNLL